MGAQVGTLITTQSITFKLINCFIHSKSLCHLDVKLDNILVFKSDFSWVKLCDFGSVRAQGDIVIKKNELLPYCPSELVAKHANEYYQVGGWETFELCVLSILV